VALALLDRKGVQGSARGEAEEVADILARKVLAAQPGIMAVAVALAARTEDQATAARAHRD